MRGFAGLATDGTALIGRDGELSRPPRGRGREQVLAQAEENPLAPIELSATLCPYD